MSVSEGWIMKQAMVNPNTLGDAKSKETPISKRNQREIEFMNAALESGSCEHMSDSAWCAKMELVGLNR